jgi:endonuclease/exonuclease/phosphatase (EEP) superfamily protein YafD
VSFRRRLVGGAGLALAAAAALAVAAGLAGMAWGWPDALNNFAPAWLVCGWAAALVTRLALPRGRARTAGLLLAAFAVLVSGGPMLAEAVRTGREAPAPATLTIVSFNRWWKAPHGEPQVRMIEASGADLVALQEADGRFSDAAAALRPLYPYQMFCGGSCTTAILSKRPFLATGRARQPEHPGGTEFIWVRVTAPDGRPVTLATVHLHWPIPPWVQRSERRRVAEMAAGLGRSDLVLAGDFNLTPWTFAMRRFDGALAPLTRRTHGLLTFPATWPVPFLALDQVYAAPEWRTVKVERLPAAASDHYPVRVELRRERAP